jgi:hypothetical protein
MDNANPSLRLTSSATDPEHRDARILFPGTDVAIPVDSQRPGAFTKAWFHYQDECAAVTVVDYLLGGRLHGIAVEYLTDFVIATGDGSLQLVSVKHREPYHRAGGEWSLSALGKALTELYKAWEATDRLTSLAFLTKAVSSVRPTISGALRRIGTRQTRSSRNSPRNSESVQRTPGRY